ncbi:MAG TPA: hypothetical protein VHM23_06840, partial [Actinomycetota bacterium]|nr:hypothetical protein [Actinomycetota bacterium]
NLEELVRTALAEEAGAEPDETGAYDRFLRHRRRGALLTAASTGLAVALVLALAVGTALVVRDGSDGRVAGPLGPSPTTAGSPDGVVRRERQGFELTLPEGWKIDQEGTRRYDQLGQAWLVISPGGRLVGMNERSMTIRTAVVEPRAYPGGPVKAPDVLGQSFSSVSGKRSSGRRPDGRAWIMGDQGGLVSYMIAWPYRCEPGAPCPEAAPLRVLLLDVGGTGGQEGLEVRRLARRLVDSIRPITNALPPAGTTVAEEPGLFADAPVVVGRGGQGDYAWEMHARKGSGQDYWIETRRQNGDLLMGEQFSESDRNRIVAWLHCMPSKERVTATLVSGFAPEATAKVRLEVRGQPPVEVPTFRKDGIPFAFWVVAPLPPDAKPQAFTGLDAAGRDTGRGTGFAGYADGCR